MAVERLNRVLPLTSRHHALDRPLQNLHKAILHAYVERGRFPTRDEMMLLIDNPNEAVNILRQKDLIVLDEEGNPTGAYPFTTLKRDHRVTVNNHTVYCMCALDALAVSPMFNLPTTVYSRCHITRESLTIQQPIPRTIIPSQTGTICFGINWGAASEHSCCADSLCTEMIFLRDSDIAVRWLSEEPEQRQIFSLTDAMDFAARFFVPLLQE